MVRSDKAPSCDHYMVVRAAGPPGRRIVLFNYEASRTTEALQNLLVGPEGPYRGKLLTDGLELYDTVAENLKLVHLGCLQHCRSYFHKAAKVTELPSGRNLARVAIEDYIRQVYGIERQIKALREEYEGRGETLPLEIVLKLRREKSAPVMAAFKKWIDELLPGVPPKSALGKALSYTAGQWTKLSQFLEQPDAPVDNNYLRTKSGRLQSEGAHGSSQKPNRVPERAPTSTHLSAVPRSMGSSHTHICSTCLSNCPRRALPRISRCCFPGTSSLC